MSLAASAGACPQCGLATSSGRFCCTGCAWMHRLLASGDEDARPESLLPRLALCAFLAVATMVFSLALIGIDPRVSDEASAALQGLYRLAALLLSFPILALLGAPLAAAIARARRLLSADALIVLAVAAAWSLSCWNTFAGGGHVYFDTASLVLVLVSLGRWLDARARSRAAESLRGAAEEGLPPVRVVRGAEERDLPLSQVRRGDVVRVRAGEGVPVDGRVLEGRAFLDAAGLTGEEEPRAVAPGERVLAGMRSLDGTFLVRAEAVGAERVRAEIERRMQAARQNRARLVRLADRISGALLFVVVCVALAAGLYAAAAVSYEEGLQRALSVLLIACPCGLGLAVPLAFESALGAAWRRGLLVRDGATLERLARVRKVLFDKTGTLTDGTPRLVDAVPAGGFARAESLAAAVALERASDHPLARALRGACAEADAPHAVDVRVLPGVGVEGLVAGRRVRLARARAAGDAPHSEVELTVDGARALSLRFAGRPRDGARAALDALRARGLSLGILTGDSSGAARAVAEELGVPFEAELLPQDKLARVQEGGGRGVLFVGDGLNDAAALAAADVGAVLHGASDLARDEAAVHVQSGDLQALPWLIDRSRRALRVARGNLAFAFAYNAAGVALAAAGRLTPVFAASAMVVSGVWLVLRSTRAEEG